MSLQPGSRGKLGFELTSNCCRARPVMAEPLLARAYSGATGGDGRQPGLVERFGRGTLV